MKKNFLTLALAWALMPLAHSATLTVSNYNGLAANGIASSNSTLVADGKGLIGRMTITDQEVETLLAEGDITSLIAAFEVFGTAASPFPVTSFAQNGLFENQITFSTIPSQENEFADSPIFIWLFVGDNRLDASEILLAKLPSVFPEDPSDGPPANASVYLRTDATFFAGGVSDESHDYGLGGGAAAKLEMEVQFFVPPNQVPVALADTLSVNRGQSASGTVTGTDDDDDTLTFFVVDAPTKGSVTIEENGSYQYTSTAGLTGNDSFTFRAYDGEDYSPAATVTVTIVDNLVPVATPGTLAVIRGQSADGTVTGIDADAGDVLTFFVVDAPAKGSVTIQQNGSYQYTSTPGLTGNDSFTFRAYDGKDYSPAATVTVTITDNAAPVATPGTLAVTRGQSANGTVTGTDTDTGDVLTFFEVDAPAKGSVTIEENGSYQYTSTPGLTGNDSFSFRAYDGIAYSAPATISVTITDLPPGSAAPVIAITELPSGYVGSYYEYAVPIANAPQGNASVFTAKALPGGLKMDKNTGIISGYPTQSYTDKPVTLLFKNDAGDSGQVPVTITIKEVPPAVVGTFLASVERNDDIADGFGGRLNLTVTSKGAFTAKLQSGPTAYMAKGKLTIAEEEEDIVVEVIGLEFSRKNFPTLTANLFFDVSDPLNSNFQLTGSIANPEDKSADVAGVRNTWTKTSKPDSYEGDYTFSLRIPFILEINPFYPQGDGFGALTVKDNGTATFVGKTSDGKAFTVPTILGPQGHLPLFSAFAVKTSSLVAIPRIVIPEAPSEDILNSITGNVSWMKPPADSKSKDRAYRLGFEAFDLSLLGGMYKAPAPGGVVAGLADNGPTDAEVNAWLRFSSSAPGEGEISTLPFTIMNKKVTGIKQTVIVPKATPKTPETDPNPNAVSFKLLPKPVGFFSGFFTLPNEVRALTRKTPFQGTIVRLSDGTYENTGFFLLAELPEGGEKITQTPQNSGLVELLAADPDVP